MFGGIAHTVALAGMSQTPTGPGHSSDISPHSFSSLGLSHAGTDTRHRDNTTLSPTAQPFTIPTASSASSGSTQATSPRSRYFAPPSTSVGSEPRSSGFSAFASVSTHASATPIPASKNAGPAASGFPGSPIRSPTGFSSWVSTGSAGNGYSGQGFPSSLGGVASTWGSHTSG
jgi:hypothetical protein